MFDRNNKEFNLKSNTLSIILMKNSDCINEIKRIETPLANDLKDHLFLLSEKFFMRLSLLENVIFYLATTTTVLGIVNNFFSRTIIVIGKLLDVISYEIANSELDPNRMPVAHRPPFKRIKLDKINGHRVLIDDLELFIQDYALYLFICISIVILIIFFTFIKNLNINKFLLIRKYTS